MIVKLSKYFFWFGLFYFFVFANFLFVFFYSKGYFVCIKSNLSVFRDFFGYEIKLLIIYWDVLDFCIDLTPKSMRMFFFVFRDNCFFVWLAHRLTEYNSSFDYRICNGLILFTSKHTQRSVTDNIKMWSKITKILGTFDNREEQNIRNKKNLFFLCICIDLFVLFAFFPI